MSATTSINHFSLSLSLARAQISCIANKLDLLTRMIISPSLSRTILAYGTTTSSPGRKERHQNIDNPCLTSSHEVSVGVSGVLVDGPSPQMHVVGGSGSSTDTDRGNPTALLSIHLAVFRPRTSEGFLLGLGSEQDLSQPAGVGLGHCCDGALLELVQGLLGGQVGGVMSFGARAEGAIRIRPTLDVV
ncbi:hypothetical protein F5Y16DRAFT_363581 [Xylariaceae sp. FL0255]|nr:hypothetical protein F5Y16DRAFT_363581 [Xylariaceae sp. FL0255]